MDKIIYTKYSNERRKELAIYTTIIKEQSGKKFVCKSPSYDEGNQHIQNLFSYHDWLEQKYINTNIKVNKICPYKSAAKFEYIEGESLEEKLDDLYAEDRFEELIEVLGNYINIIRSVNNEQFYNTNEFEEVFGELPTNISLKAGNINNIDMILGNIIIKDDQWSMIDYEWTFNFPIPVNFIIFRILFHYIDLSVQRENLKKIDLYKVYGITEEEKELYFAMEMKFQRYVISNMVPVREMYSNISPGSVSLETLIQFRNELNELKMRYEICELNAKNLENELQSKSNRLQQVESEFSNINHRLYMAESSFHQIQGSFCWKITKPIRMVLDLIKRVFNKFYRLGFYVKSILYFIKGGISKSKEWQEKKRKSVRSYYTETEFSLCFNLNVLEQQRKTNSSLNQKFSIIVPVYNTPELYLRKMIESVLLQTYDNFELCISDGSDSNHKYVRKICKYYAFYDKRIKYKKLQKNLGISENSNYALKMSKGNYIVLLDHDDILHPSALYEANEIIENKGSDFVYTDETTFCETIDHSYNPHYKPDFSPDYLRGINYICHLTIFSRHLYEKVGGFNKRFDGSQDYDMILRLTEKAQKISHIPKILYYWRAHSESVAMQLEAKSYCVTAAKEALSEHLKRLNIKGTVVDSTYPSAYRIKYDIVSEELVSIIIPNKDHKEDLERCINSISNKTHYKNYEIIIVENNSETDEIFDYYETLKHNDNINVVVWDGEFNYSEINNYAVNFAKGEYILLLNNDTEVITNDWLEEMIMFLQRKDIGAVGAKLYYPDNTIQHAGVIVGVQGVGGHSHKHFKREELGYVARLALAQNLSAVTAACLMVKKQVYNEINGLDPLFKVAFNDVDFCMRIREAGYLIVFTPYAELYHYESISRGEEDTPEKKKRFEGEVNLFLNRWKEQLNAGDPYYNPNLSLLHNDFREKKYD